MVHACLSDIVKVHIQIYINLFLCSFPLSELCGILPARYTLSSFADFSQSILSNSGYHWMTSLADLESNILLSEEYPVLSSSLSVQIMRNTAFVTVSKFYLLWCVYIQVTEDLKADLFWFSTEINKRGSWQILFIYSCLWYLNALIVWAHVYHPS